MVHLKVSAHVLAARIHIRENHQIETILSGPAKGILTMGTHPDGRVRTLNWLGKDVDVVVLEEFATEVNRLVRPGLPDDLGRFSR